MRNLLEFSGLIRLGISKACQNICVINQTDIIFHTNSGETTSGADWLCGLFRSETFDVVLADSDRQLQSAV
jgi:hypothetical protein